MTRSKERNLAVEKISDKEIEDAIEIYRCACPVCSDRGYVDLDCRTCGGIDWVDISEINDIVVDDLLESYFRKRSAPSYLAFGLYTVLTFENEVETFLVRVDRSVVEVSNQVDRIWMRNHAKNCTKRWSVWALLRWTRNRMRGAT